MKKIHRRKVKKLKQKGQKEFQKYVKNAERKKKKLVLSKMKIDKDRKKKSTKIN